MDQQPGKAVERESPLTVAVSSDTTDTAVVDATTTGIDTLGLGGAKTPTKIAEIVTAAVGEAGEAAGAAAAAAPVEAAGAAGAADAAEERGGRGDASSSDDAGGASQSAKEQSDDRAVLQVLFET